MQDGRMDMMSIRQSDGRGDCKTDGYTGVLEDRWMNGAYSSHFLECPEAVIFSQLSLPLPALKNQPLPFLLRKAEAEAILRNELHRMIGCEIPDAMNHRARDKRIWKMLCRMLLDLCRYHAASLHSLRYLSNVQTCRRQICR